MFRSPFNIVFRGRVSIFSEPGFGGKYSKLNLQGAFFLTCLSKIVGEVFNKELCLQQANLETLKDNFTLKVKVTSCSKVI